MKINYIKFWREIGDAFAEPYWRRTEWQKKLTQFGLCWAMNKSAGVSYNAIRGIGGAMRTGTHWWPDRTGSNSDGFTTSIDHERSMFAYFMSELGNKGYEELIKAAQND